MPEGVRNGNVSDRRSGDARLVALAYILAISMPPLGLIFGIVMALRSGRRYSKHGLGVIAVSIVAGIVWAVIIGSGALNTTTSGY